ncbi:MAG: DNA gyrase inhibitor YacG [Betaproteobacteria bacterium]
MNVKIVNCPRCARPVPWTPASKFRPFCSQRCKTNDLGAWASEQYRVPGEPLPDNLPPAGADGDDGDDD